MSYLQTVRWLSWPGGGLLCSRHISHLQLSQSTHLPHPLQNKHPGHRTSDLCLCRTSRCIFSTLCVVRSKPNHVCSLCRQNNAEVCSGSHVSLQKNRLSRNAWSARNLMTTPVQRLFWERDPKSGYGSKIKQNPKELIRDGFKELRTEISKWQDEVKEKFEDDPILVRPGDMDKMWVLNSDKALDTWIVTSDSDHGEGFSSASLTISPTGHGLFSGHISTQVPGDGNVKRSGYCNMKSIRPMKSFKRESFHDWTLYTHLEIRVRGDGRTYLINLGTSGYFDVMWNDIYSYILYTRGGPHWQLTRIPFSKFFLNSKGRVQDKQCPIALERVTSLGISAGDRINAPFHLEIDYIGAYHDPNHSETFAYEMYRVPRYMGY